MKAVLALAFAAALAAPAAAQEDPKVEFLGHCIAQGSSSNYCACMADALGGALPGNDFTVYNHYLQLVASGQTEPNAMIEALTKAHGISKKDLARILTAANEVVTNEQTCSGL